jgi:UDP-2,3-diacylglucosamine hydrolase
MKKIYILSDVHLGSWAIEHRRTHERRIVSFLDKIKDEAAAVYLLGDVFDFWYEYRYAVPKGFTRFLGKVSELTDRGVEVHFFTGNHDQWCLDYFEKECGMIIHNEPCLVELYGKEFFLAHGDEFSKEKSYKVLRALFRSRLTRMAFSMLHPRWGLWMGHKWSQYSMKQHKVKGDTPYLGEEKEHCIIFAREYLKKHSSVDCFIFGHRHIDVDIPLGENSRCIFLGDWIYTFAYVVWDGKTISHERYVEGDVAQVMSQG